MCFLTCVGEKVVQHTILASAYIKYFLQFQIKRSCRGYPEALSEAGEGKVETSLTIGARRKKTFSVLFKYLNTRAMQIYYYLVQKL